MILRFVWPVLYHFHWKRLNITSRSANMKTNRISRNCIDLNPLVEWNQNAILPVSKSDKIFFHRSSCVSSISNVKRGTLCVLITTTLRISIVASCVSRRLSKLTTYQLWNWNVWKCWRRKVKPPSAATAHYAIIEGVVAVFLGLGQGEGSILATAIDFMSIRCKGAAGHALPWSAVSYIYHMRVFFAVSLRIWMQLLTPFGLLLTLTVTAACLNRLSICNAALKKMKLSKLLIGNWNI